MATKPNTYELTYIVNAVLSEEQLKEVVGRVQRHIESLGGETLSTNEWGTRRLAYPIRKKRNGYYVNLYFRAGGEIIARLERLLEIDDDILRYLTLKYDAKMLRHFEKYKGEIPRTRAAEAQAAAPAPAKEEDEEE